MRRHRWSGRALTALALAAAAAGCGGDGDRQVSQDGKGGYPWVATEEICNALPYGELADPLGARREVADRTGRSGGGAPGFACVQPLVETGPAVYGNAKVELDFAFTESVDFARDIHARDRENTAKEVKDSGLVPVQGVGKEAFRFGYDKPAELHQVRELHVRDSNLLLDVTVTADARTPPTPESLKALDAAVDAFAKGCLKSLRTRG
ncbi:hypothetical protein [Streptomyces sp. NPDC060031]|uniref:hypothetical protein n=1 Tax=Streptomyces sp. NPDC060031 TaxID=3347043 RepID=UPI00368A31AB